MIGDVPASPLSTAQAARRRLGARLRRLREGAGLSGEQFSVAAGWRPSNKSTVSMVESGQRTITEQHVFAWCRICNAPEQLREELLAEQANVAGMWRTWREMNRAGLAAAHRAARGRYDEVKVLRGYSADAFHSLLQSPGYIKAVLSMVRHQQKLATDDVDEAVVERLARQSVLDRNAKFLFVVEGHVLRHRVVPKDVLREQLHHLLAVMRRPSVSLGIIPLYADRVSGGDWVWPEAPFTAFDAKRVNVELVSGFLTATAKEEISAYLEAFERLRAIAVYGDRAAAEIDAAMADLDR